MQRVYYGVKTLYAPSVVQQNPSAYAPNRRYHITGNVDENILTGLSLPRHIYSPIRALGWR